MSIYAWRTPSVTPPQKFWVRRLLIPASREYAEIVNGALAELTYAANFEADGAATPDECAAAFSTMYAAYVDNEQDPPFYGDEDDIDDEKPVSQPWYEDLADWVIEGFLAVSGFPTAAIVYSTSVPKIRFALRTGDAGALFRVLLNNIEMYTGDSYAPIRGLLGHTLDLQAFADANDLGDPPWTLRIEHAGSGENIAEGQTAYLEVVRKKLTDELPMQFRQTDPCLLEFSDDGGETWSTAADLSACSSGGGIPTGAMLPTGLSAAPSGYLMCDGSAVSRTTYAALFAAIGTAFGVGDGSTTFNVPNSPGRDLIGAGQGSGLTNRVLGASGGAETHQLSVTEMPSHTHNLKPFYPLGYAQTTLSAGVRSDYLISTLESGATGGDGAHNNMQPYLVVAYMIKT